MSENDVKGVWRTIGGRRVFIKDGQDLASAMKASGKFKNLKNEDYQKQEQIVHEAKNEVDKLKKQLSLLENDDTYESPDYDETKYALQDAEDRYREEKAKYDKMNNKSFNTEDEAFIKDLTEHYDEFTRGDLQGAIEAKYGFGEKSWNILKEVDTRIENNDRKAYQKYLKEHPNSKISYTDFLKQL